MWKLRHLIPGEPGTDCVLDQDVFSDGPDVDEHQIGLALLQWDGDVGGDYQQSLPVKEQDTLMKQLNCLRISARKFESESEKGLDTDLDPTVWEFVKLLSRHIDQNALPNLYGMLQTPAENTIANMLQNHKLRSTYDFEQAVTRSLDLNNAFVHKPQKWNGSMTWNFRVLDLAAGRGTAVNTIFGLKEAGVFRGAKRKLKFTGDGDPSDTPKKCPKMDSLTKLLGAMEFKNENGNSGMCNRSQIKIKVSESIGRWHGGKKSPPKLTLDQGPGKKGMPQGRKKIDLAKTPGPKTPRTPGNRGRKPSAPANHSAGDQASILDFVIATPRRDVVGSPVHRNRMDSRNAPADM